MVGLGPPQCLTLLSTTWVVSLPWTEGHKASKHTSLIWTPLTSLLKSSLQSRVKSKHSALHSFLLKVSNSSNRSARVMRRTTCLWKFISNQQSSLSLPPATSPPPRDAVVVKLKLSRSISHGKAPPRSSHPTSPPTLSTRWRSRHLPLFLRSHSLCRAQPNPGSPSSRKLSSRLESNQVENTPILMSSPRN